MLPYHVKFFCKIFASCRGLQLKNIKGTSSSTEPFFFGRLLASLDCTFKFTREIVIMIHGWP